MDESNAGLIADDVRGLIATSILMLEQMEKDGKVTRGHAAILSTWDSIWEKMLAADQSHINLK